MTVDEKGDSSFWSREQDKAFENAIATHSEDLEDNWEKIAADVPGKTLEEVKNHYELLFEDVKEIEAGRVPLPSYSSSSEGSSGLAAEEGNGGKKGQFANAGSEPNQGSKASKADQERRKGIAWTEDEHRQVCYLILVLYLGMACGVAWWPQAVLFVPSSTKELRPRHDPEHKVSCWARPFLSRGVFRLRQPSENFNFVIATNTLFLVFAVISWKGWDIVEKETPCIWGVHCVSHTYRLAHRIWLFLLGLEKYGKGDWRSISRNFVVTRTPTQVASHAQKYFIRLNSMNKDRRRSSIHDITNVNSGDVSASQGPITGQVNAPASGTAPGKTEKLVAQPPAAPSGVGMYGTPTIGQPISGPLVSAVGTPVNLPPPHMAYGVRVPVPGSVVPGAPMGMAPLTYPMPHTSAHR
uniref:Transcription factor SRM1 n=1 Tax=Chenopodium quinoa TaxID=63459 RepID=A0A803LS08_CHEQI